MSPQKRRNISFLIALAILVVVSSIGLGAGTSTVNTVATTTAGRFTGKVSSSTQSGAAVAQQAVAQKQSTTTGVQVVNQVAMGQSVALRTLKPDAPVQGRIESDSGTLSKGRTDALPVQPKEAYNVEPKVPNAMPTPLGTFEGTGNLSGVQPPDSDGAVGPNHFVEWINLSMQVFDKSGNSLLGPISGNQIFAGLPSTSLCRTTNSGDPIVLYDELADRWLLSQFAFTSAEHPTDECIAISKTGDPTGEYWLYDFVADPDNLADYPHFGVWPDGYYMTVNLFTPIQNNWVGSGQIVFDRAKMLNGEPATAQVHKILGLEEWGGMMPADFDGTNLPPAGAPNYLAEITDDEWYPGVYTDEIQYYKFHVDWTTPANSTFTGPINLPVAAFDGVPCSSANVANCIPQPGTSQKLEVSWDRVMWRLAYRNFGDHESLVFNHSVDADGTGTGHSGVRWYELRNPENPTIYQYGTYAPDANARWMGSAAMDAQGNLAIGFSESNSTNLYPSIYYAGRLAGDPLGQLAQGEAQMFPGAGSQTSSFGRWGDYTALTVDPVDDCTFWYINEYLSSTSGSNWRTRIGSFKFPGCSAAGSPTPTPTGAVPTATNTVTATPVANTPTATAPASTSTPTSVATSQATSTATSVVTAVVTNTPGASPTPCTLSFSDVNSTDYFYESVMYLACHGAISGYSDGTFRPYNNTTRGQLSKIVVLAVGWTIDTTGGPHFSDVPTNNPFYDYIETAFNHQIISGYGDGTFRWGNNVTRGQLSKIVVEAMGWDIDTSGGPHFTDVPTTDTFYNWIETAYNRGIISGYSDNTFRPGNNATRGQIAKIVYGAITAP